MSDINNNPDDLRAYLAAELARAHEMWADWPPTPDKRAA
jgi:hypothetical protein